MSVIETIPKEHVISLRNKMIPGYMYPNDWPLAVVVSGVLSGNECDAIVEYGKKLPSYEVGGCNAVTRECHRPLDPVLGVIWGIGKYVNDNFFHFDINLDAAAWLQSYTIGSDYHMHTDAIVGQSRKLTAVAMLTDPYHYTGGDLELLTFQDPPFVVDKTRGSVVVFPGWTVHQVTEITKGHRQTINMGWWGPPFK